MRADSPPADPFRIPVRKVKAFRLIPVQAKLVFMTPGCNVRMAAGLHIGIHANRRRRRPASPYGQSRRLLHQDIEFRLGFGIEKQNSRVPASPTSSIVQRFTNLVPILADAGENDALPAHADALQVAEFPARYNVKTAS